MDLMQRKGEYNVPPQAGPILGVEFAGVIEELGKGNVSGFNVGDEVFGLAYGGAYAEYIASSTKMLIYKPGELSWEEAAGIPETWITATQALHLVGCLKDGDNVLFHAGASSVAIAGIQLAKAAGAKAVFVTAGSDEKIKFCEQELGATKGFNYHTTDWVKGIHDATDNYGVDVIIDVIGGDYAQKNFKVAATDARIVQLASMGGSTVSNLDISLLEGKRLRWEGSRLRSRNLEYQGKLRDLLVEKALPKFVDGTFKVQIDKTFNWKDIQAAHTWMESNTSKGKIMCVVE
jgi:NADPH:quinone reductase-like Zn-dependent oxidoreductase